MQSLGVQTAEHVYETEIGEARMALAGENLVRKGKTLVTVALGAALFGGLMVLTAR